MPFFTGPGFHLTTVEQLGASTIRVSFSQYPKTVDASATNDALNPDNYALSGVERNYITAVSLVADDLQSVDVTTASPLLVGSWDLTVSSIVQDDLSSLTAPTAITFLVTTEPTQTPLDGGTTNDEVSAVLRKHFNPALKGDNWDAILAGIAAGDSTNWNNAKAAFDQFFISTASQIYLDRRAGDQGQKRPADIGMTDDLFRKLAVSVKNKKLTEQAILEVLEVFYGTDATRAYAQSEIAEPYSFSDADELVLLIDEKQTVTISFEETHFVRTSEAYAIEVAAEITRALKAAGSDAYAIEYDDPTTGTNKIRIYSGSLGLTSSIRVMGGKMQTVLRFPEGLFSVPFTSTDWDWDPVSGEPDYMRFTGGDWFDLDLVQEGDLVYIYGSPFLTSGFLGTYPVTAVGAYYDVDDPMAERQQYFEILAPGTDAGSGTQSSFTSMMFFRPKKRTIYDEARHVVVAETDGLVNIIIPATTQVVTRTPGTGAYLNNGGTISPDEIVRVDGETVEVVTGSAHGLVVGDQILIDDVFPSGDEAPVYPNDPSGSYTAGEAEGVTEASLATTASESNTFEGFEHHVLRLREGKLMVIGGETSVSGVHTALVNPVILEITDETVEPTYGGRWQEYRWLDLDSHAYTIGQRQFATSIGTGDDAGAIGNDRVLATGGTAGDDATGTSEDAWDLFTYSDNPPQDIQVSGTMPVARAGHAQESLSFYEIICGGWTTAGTPIASTYTFDLDTLAWTIRGAMNRARMKHQLTKYQHDTDVLALASGGLAAGGKVLNHCEAYEVNTEDWRVVGPMTFARYDHASIRIPDGRIIVFGGTGYNPTQSQTPMALTSVEIFDPRTETWNRLNPMKVPRSRPAVAYIPSRNAIYVAGSSTMIEIFDLETMTWTKPIVGLGYGFNNSQGGCVGDDTFVVIGGTMVGPISGRSTIRTYAGQPL